MARLTYFAVSCRTEECDYVVRDLETREDAVLFAKGHREQSNHYQYHVLTVEQEDVAF